MSAMNLSATDEKFDKFRRVHERFVARYGPWPFAIETADAQRVQFGTDDPAYTLRSVDAVGDSALACADLLALGDAFIAGSIAIDGDIRKALQSRKMLKDFHPLIWVSRFAGRFVTRNGKIDAGSIAAHYDREPGFFAQFLDDTYMCYTEGDFSTGATTLEAGIEAKLGFALDSLRLEPGARILDVGAGWGAFSRYAGPRGYIVDSLTLSEESRRYLTEHYRKHDIQGSVHLAHFLHHDSSVKYDGIVNMGATEHLPDYRASMRQYAKLVRPQGRLYVDALAMRSGIHISSFMTRHVYPGNSRPMVLPSYLRAAIHHGFAIERVDADATNYAITCRLWAERLQRSRGFVEAAWGARSYRIFFAYLMASSVGFEDGLIQAYRLSLRYAP